MSVVHGVFSLIINNDKDTHKKENMCLFELKNKLDKRNFLSSHGWFYSFLNSSDVTYIELIEQNYTFI
jgi:hypothetical protein